MHKLRGVGAWAPVWWRSRGAWAPVQYRVLQHIQCKILPKFVHFPHIFLQKIFTWTGSFPRWLHVEGGGGSQHIWVGARNHNLHQASSRGDKLCHHPYFLPQQGSHDQAAFRFQKCINWSLWTLITKLDSNVHFSTKLISLCPYFESWRDICWPFMLHCKLLFFCLVFVDFSFPFLPITLSFPVLGFFFSPFLLIFPLFPLSLPLFFFLNFFPIFWEAEFFPYPKRHLQEFYIRPVENPSKSPGANPPKLKRFWVVTCTLWVSQFDRLLPWIAAPSDCFGRYGSGRG